GRTSGLFCIELARRNVMSKHTRRLEIEVLEERSLMSADMVVQWNAVALSAVRHDYDLGHVRDQGGPTMDSRALAIVSAAVFDAAVAAAPAFTPSLVRLHARAGASLDAAVATAAHDSLAALYPHQQEMIDTAFLLSLASLGRHHSVGSVLKGMEVGHTAAAA